MKSELRTNDEVNEAEREFMSRAKDISGNDELAGVTYALIANLQGDDGTAHVAFATKRCGCHTILLSFSNTKDITQGICYDLTSHESIHIGAEVAKVGRMVPEGYLLGLELMSMGVRMAIEEYSHGHHFKETPELLAAMDAESAYLAVASKPLFDRKEQLQGEGKSDPVKDAAIEKAVAGMRGNPIGQMMAEIVKRGVQKSMNKLDDEKASKIIDDQTNALVDKEGVNKGGKFGAHHVEQFIAGVKSDSRFAISTYPVATDRSKAEEFIKNAEGIVVAFVPRGGDLDKDLKVIGVFGWDDTFMKLVDAADAKMADAGETTPQISTGLAIARGFGEEVATRKFDSMQDLANRYAKVVSEVGQRSLQDRMEAAGATKH